MRPIVFSFKAAVAALCVLCPLGSYAQAEMPPTPVSIATPQTATLPPAVNQPIRILFAGTPLSAPSSEAVPYRDPTDGAICLSPEALTPLGGVYVVDEKMGKVTFTTADGTATATVDLRTPPADGPSRGHFVPAVETVTALGGKCEWEATTNTLYVRSVLTGVDLAEGKLVLRASLPIQPRVVLSEGKVIIDIPGAEVGALPKVLPLNDPAIAMARTGQFESDTARVVLEMRGGGAFALSDVTPATQVTLSPVAAKPRAVAVAKAKTSAPPAGQPTTVVRTVLFQKISDQRMQFVVSAGRTPATRVALVKGRLTLDLLNATLAPNVAETLKGVKHPFLLAAQMVAQSNNVARLMLDLNRAVSFSVKPDGSGRIVLDIRMPRGAGGSLVGKLVVVDAGHGGDDAGAIGVNGAKEKDVNLAVAGALADSLREAGANVIMTRAGDFFLTVGRRPAIANQAGADFFLSIHSDSGPSRLSGSTVYFHSDDPHCRSLAQCIADRFEQMGSIPSRGIRTDYVRFPGSGYGVLRGARMVAVLIECGYMSNARDVRLLTQPEMQQKIAAAITAGLRDYIEGNPSLDTRNVNPEAGAPGDIPPPLSEPDADREEATARDGSSSPPAS